MIPQMCAVLVGKEAGMEALKKGRHKPPNISDKCKKCVFFCHALSLPSTLIREYVIGHPGAIQKHCIQV